ncbi:MAG: hypothetical protein WBM86_10775, partial [Waterburya sp.]
MTKILFALVYFCPPYKNAIALHCSIFPSLELKAIDNDKAYICIDPPYPDTRNRENNFELTIQLHHESLL